MGSYMRKTEPCQSGRMYLFAKEAGLIALEGSNPSGSAVGVMDNHRERVLIHYMEAWMSGLNQQFTKLSTGKTVREFESHRLRH